jgi:hypothetical protein
VGAGLRRHDVIFAGCRLPQPQRPPAKVGGAASPARRPFLQMPAATTSTSPRRRSGPTQASTWRAGSRWKRLVRRVRLHLLRSLISAQRRRPARPGSRLCARRYRAVLGRDDNLSQALLVSSRPSDGEAGAQSRDPGRAGRRRCAEMSERRRWRRTLRTSRFQRDPALHVEACVGPDLRRGDVEVVAAGICKKGRRAGEGRHPRRSPHTHRGSRPTPSRGPRSR